MKDGNWWHRQKDTVPASFNPCFYTPCPIFSSIASKLREEIQKTYFLKNAFLWKLAIFREKRSKFRPFSQIFYFSSYLHKHVIDPHHLGDFQHNLAYISGKMALKVPKISQFWTPNFLINWKMYALRRRVSREPWRILRRGFSSKIKSLFWPWTPYRLKTFHRSIRFSETLPKCGESSSEHKIC